MACTIIAPASLAVAHGGEAGSPVVAVGQPAGRHRRAAGRIIDVLDHLTVAITESAHPVIALLPATEGHPDDVRIRWLVDAAGVVRIGLPDDPAEAMWCVAVARELSPADHHAVVRALEVLCNGPEVVERAPRRRWGPHGIDVPALRPVTLARLASCAWVPCSWCARGGAVGYPCRRCGAPIVSPVTREDAP